MKFGVFCSLKSLYFVPPQPRKKRAHKGNNYPHMAAAASRVTRKRTYDGAALEAAVDLAVAAPIEQHTVLGKGAFGCVLAPAYACSDSSEAERATVRAAMRPGVVYVSKLMNSEESMLTEWERLLRVRDVDPGGEFTVPMAGMCSAVVPLEDVQDAAPSAGKCGAVMSASLQLEHARTQDNKPAGQLRQLVLEYGGVDWWHVATSPQFSGVPLAVVLRSLTPVVLGLPKLAAAAVFHKDVKPSNVVFDGAASRLVDFGVAATTAQDLFNHRTIYSTYEFWPPECDFLAASTPWFMKTDGPNSTKTTANYLRRLYVDVAEAQEQLDEMKARLAREAPADSDGLKTFLTTKFSAKFDVFGLGLCVLHVLLFSGAGKLAGFDTSKLLQWISHVVNYNAFDRWDAARAATEWTKMWTPPRRSLRKPKPRH